MIADAISNPDADSSDDSQSKRVLEELKVEARSLGLEPEYVSVGVTDDHDQIPVIVGKPDGRSLKRLVPKECLGESNYRSSLLRNMLTMLA